MISSYRQEDDFQKWKNAVNKRVKRLENLFCIQAILVIVAFVSFLIYQSTSFYFPPSIIEARHNTDHSTFHVQKPLQPPQNHARNAKETKVDSLKFSKKSSNNKHRSNRINKKIWRKSDLAKKMNNRLYSETMLSSNEPSNVPTLQVDNLGSRKLDEATLELSVSEMDNNINCSSLSILSPIGAYSNFTLDKRVHDMLHIIDALTSPEALLDSFSPQYKAACWILHDDKHQISPENDLMVQRYVVAVFIYTLWEGVTDSILSMNTCDYPIVSCNDEGHVTSIIANSDILRGTIPSEISHLKHLEVIDLSMNQLFGTIPSELGRLNKVQTLDFSNNTLSGALPTHLGNALNLVSVVLQFNAFEGSIPSEMGQLKKLSLLNLHENSMTGSIPKELLNCESLLYLSLANNMFSGSIPTEIHRLQLLEIMRLSSNQYTGIIPSGVGSLLSIKDLWLYDNELTGPLPEEIGNLASLESLWINNNQLTGTLPDIFGNLNNLTEVSLSANEFEGELPKSLWDFSQNIVFFQARGNNIEGSIPDAFCDQSILEVDDSLWFIDEPEVSCDCCDSIRCHIWTTDQIRVPDDLSIFDLRLSFFPPERRKLGEDFGEQSQLRRVQEFPNEGGIRTTQQIPSLSDIGEEGFLNENENEMNFDQPTCPEGNIRPFHFSFDLEIFDHIANVTLFEHTHDGTGSSNICMSPTGCYSVSYHEINSDEISLTLGYSSMSNSLAEQGQCDAVEVCGTFFDAKHPKRKGLNHLTQVAVPDLSILDDPSLPEYNALCWIMTQDSLFEDYDVCDGTLFQRFELVLFYLAHGRSIDGLHRIPTCEWEGITCEENNKFVIEINFSNQGLEGALVRGIDFLLRLEKIDLSHNNLSSELERRMFDHMPFLKIFDISDNKIEGLIPRTLFEGQHIQSVNISNNRFSSAIPSNTCSDTLEVIDIANNLMWGTLEGDSLNCSSLQHLDISRNNFEGSIPIELGSLENMKVLALDQNDLSGSIPTELFTLSQLEVLRLQTNEFTGNIPTQIGGLNSARVIALDHNEIQGEIPTELTNLKMLQLLHLHQNKLTGTAPDMSHINRTENYSYISDCATPNYKLSNPLECDSCSMCCNSENKCQENRHWPFSIPSIAWMVTFLLPIAILLVAFIISKILTRFSQPGHSLSNIYQNNSVYCLIFSKNFFGWCIAVVTIFIQGSILYVFLRASRLTGSNNDWRFSFRCLKNNMECLDQNKVTVAGEFLFYFVTISYLGVDFVQSCNQLIMAVKIRDISLLISGLGIFGLTALAMFTTAVYNWALADKNTDLVVNAVILLFVNDLDEKLLDVMEIAFPEWLAARFVEIEQNMAEKDEKNGISRPDIDAEDDDNSVTVEPSFSIRGGSMSLRSFRWNRGSITGPR